MTNREHILRYLSSKPCEPMRVPVRMTGITPGYTQEIDLPVCERGMFSTGYDVFGVHWTFVEPASHYTQGQAEIVSDIERWSEQLRVPNVERFDWEYVRAQNDKLDRENCASIVTMLVGVFERTSVLSNFENCLVNAITEPEAYADLVGAIVDFRIALIHRLADCCKPDIINLHDDWGTNKGPIMSPALWRKTIKPHTKRLYDACMEHDMLVCQHSCGNLGELVGDIVEMGAQVWEAQGNVNDTVAIQQKYAGRLRVLSPQTADAQESDEPAGGDPFSGGPLPRSFIPYDAAPEFLFD